MRPRFAALAALFALAAAPLAAHAAEDTAMPMFKVLPQHGDIHPHAQYPAGATLPTWNGTIRFSGTLYNFSMVGTNPATTNSTTTLKVYVIPIKMVYGAANGKMTFDPGKDTVNGVTVTQNLLNSPLFNARDWKWGKTNMGTTQYEDAFQRGSFWKDVSRNANYHVVFAAPVVLAEQTINVPSTQGGIISNPFGSGMIGTMDIDAFDMKLQTYMKKFSQINPGVLPLFVTDNIYLTQQGECCIGGYHSADTNSQTYAHASYVTSTGSFSQDISAFSHELGEWYDDPMTTSNSPCGVLEVADPLENLPNFGDFSVKFHGVTWHPQALAFMEYFGSPARFSVNNWFDNQNQLRNVCENGS